MAKERPSAILPGASVPITWLLLSLCFFSCNGSSAGPAVSDSTREQGTAGHAAFDERVAERHRMVDLQIATRDITQAEVLRAMRRVPRHRFVIPELQDQAYADSPLPLGHSQTISQPYIVAFMTEALGLDATSKILEIGTGSGYQAAVLAEIVREVYTIEIVEPLARRAQTTLADLGYTNVHVRAGDGYRGWPEEAPFDAVMVTAAPDHVPQPLVDQLAVGGLMILPVGTGLQELVLIEKTESGSQRRAVLPVRFVPMTGEAMKR